MRSEAMLKKLVPTLFEDDLILAVVKPAGVDASRARPGCRPGIAELLAEVRGQKEMFYVANRLTRYESGVLLLGKNNAITEHIRTGYKTGRVTQEYLVVSRGRMAQARMQIDPAHGASRGRARDSAAARRGRGTRSTGPRPTSATAPIGRTQLTRVAEGKGRTLLRCRTTVPNTHALRAQLRSVRLRMLGDSVADRSHRPAGPSTTCLHLCKVAFFHPVRKSKVTITTRAPEGYARVAWGGRDVERALQAALVRRLPFLLNPETDAYRLLSGEAEDVRGLVAERFAGVVILQVSSESPALVDSLPGVARWYRRTLGVEAVYVKCLDRKRSEGGVEPSLTRRNGQGPYVASRQVPLCGTRRVKDRLTSFKPLLGRTPPEQVEISERGLTFAIKPRDGVSVGLFLDQRDNRHRVRSLAEDRDVLNLFAYTCGFSVAAAAGRARSTVSVDISPKSLTWGRGNFALNGIELERHQFIRSDAAELLTRAKRQEMMFDLIVLDPPTFAHGRTGKGTFSLSRDLPAVIAGAVSLLRPGGVMMISVNYRRLQLKDLRNHLRRGAAGRRYHVIETPPLPPDFAVDPDHAKTLFAQFA